MTDEIGVWEQLRDARLVEDVPWTLLSTEKRNHFMGALCEYRDLIWHGDDVEDE